MRVLVLGGYGLIGAEVCRRLLRDGLTPVGLGRSAETGKAKLPQIDWREADIARLDTPAAWRPLIEDVDAVVNCAGALQTGLKDDVRAVQSTAMKALFEACTEHGPKRVIQISAPDASTDSDTAFYATKGEADDALKTSGLDWTVLRPGLVISEEAYGGTALLRGLAACPWVQPLTFAGARMAVVAADDVARAVSDGVRGAYSKQDLDLVRGEAHTLEDLVLRFRSWLGFPAPRAIIRLPRWMAKLAGFGADLAGWLGWRSALRSNAQRVLSAGVTGNADAWTAAGGHRLKTLNEIFLDLPATAQERRFARLQFAYPALLITLALFWIVSGLIGIARQDQATSVLTSAWSDNTARAAVLSGAVADIVIGLALLFRPLTRLSAFASIAVAAGYLLGASLWVPALWLDPLGPLVKVFPAMALGALIALIPLDR